jgi:hypothetical protein
MTALEWAKFIKSYAILGVMWSYLATHAILIAITSLSEAADIAWLLMIGWALLWLGIQHLAILYIKAKDT